MCVSTSFKTLHAVCITDMHLGQATDLTFKTHSYPQNTSYFFNILKPYYTNTKEIL